MWRRRLLAGVFTAVILVLVPAAGETALAAQGGGTALEGQAVARVGDELLSRQEFEWFLAARLRQQFYHGGVSEERMAEARRQVLQEWVDLTLLGQEARRRGIEVDKADLERQLAVYGSHGDSEQIAYLRGKLQQDQLLAGLKGDIAKSLTLSPADIRAYYEQNKDKFTTPERVRLAVILLKVPPYAPPKAWQQQLDTAAQHVAQLRDGSRDFAELAKQISDHESAAAGGDLGFVHEGMLNTEAQQVVDRLAPGEVSDPVGLLQGIGIFRLEERIPARLNEFGAVRERAEQLLRHEREARAWAELIQRLRHENPAVLSSDGA